MKMSGFVLLLVPAMALAEEGIVPDRELSLGGVDIGDAPAQVVARLGEPRRKVTSMDFLDLHYDYPHLQVSFDEDIVVGLHADKSGGCTPKGLCPGDRFDRMRALYGEPLVSDRETGRFYEYYADGAACWLQIPARGKRVASITVACQP